jgi:hypothetical protein
MKAPLLDAKSYGSTATADFRGVAAIRAASRYSSVGEAGEICLEKPSCKLLRASRNAASTKFAVPQLVLCA